MASHQFCLLAGFSAYLSLKNRKNLVSFLRERSIKLILVFVIANVVLAAPSNYLIFLYRYRRLISWRSFIRFMSSWNAYQEPGHISFLPYLFGLSITHLPLFASYLQLIRNADTVHYPSKPSRPSAATSSSLQIWWIYLYFAIFSYSIGLDATVKVLVMSYILLIIYNLFVVQSVSENPNDKEEEKYHHLLFNVRHAISPLDVSWNPLSVAHQFSYALLHNLRKIDSTTLAVYSLLFPLILNFLTFRLWHFFQVPVDAILLMYCLPICLLASSATTIHLHLLPRFLRPSQTFSSSFPVLPINLPLVAILSVVFGQLVVAGYPTLIPFLSSETTVDRSGSLLSMLTTLNFVPKKEFYGLILMAFSHSAFFLVGFCWILCERKLPFPGKSNSIAIFFCISIMFWPALIFPEHFDVFYVTAGYVTLHGRAQRLFYHAGGWLICWACVGYLKREGDFDYEAANLEGKILRFLRDTTFATFLFHPLYGYIVGYYLDVHREDYTFEQCIIILNVVVYILSFATSYLLTLIPTGKVRSLRNPVGQR